MPARPTRRLSEVPRRSLAFFLSGLVAWASLAALDRVATGTPSAELRKAGADHPAIHQPVRPETRLGRSPGPDLPVAGAVAAGFAPALPAPSICRLRRAELEPFRAGRPVSPSRGSRGPPGRLS